MGSEVGRSGPQPGKSPSIPLGCVAPGSAPWAVQPLCDAELGKEEDEDANVVLNKHKQVYPLPLPVSKNRSSRTNIIINGCNHTLILDTGAEVSILPKSFLANHAIHSHHRTHKFTVHAFGGGQVEIEGPYFFHIRVCAVSFMHPFFVLYNGTQFVCLLYTSPSPRD